MPTSVSLPHMVDLALGSPEVGAVNFNVLHTLLHAMINKLGLGDVKADLNDDDREFLSTGVSHGKSSRDRDHSDKDSTTRGDDSVLDESILSEYSAPGKSPESPRQKVPYHKLENRVAELAKALQDLNSLPGTQDFFEGKGYGVRDMWQGMQMKKRVDANEEGVGKLMLMMQDLMKEMAQQKAENRKLKDLIDGLLKLDVDDLMKRLGALEETTNGLQEDLNKGLGEIKDLRNRLDGLPTFDDIGQFVRWADLEDALKGIRFQLEKLNFPMPERVVVEMAMQTEKILSRPTSASSRPASRSSSGPSQELLDILESLGLISSKHLEFERRIKKLEDDMLNKMDKGAMSNIGLTEDMLRELNKMKNDIDVLKISMSKDHDAVTRLQQMLKLIEAAIDKLNKTTQDLKDDCSEKGRKIKKLYEICDGLERKKADKEYVDTEVDVKADKKQLDGKVNHNLFDDTTNEINRTIQEILKQLAGNSDEWKNMLARLMNDIDGKLDRIELNPLKDWLEKKLKALSKKIQDGQLQWNDDEAAGLKRQLIQHYHCLSCDKPVNLMPTGLQPSTITYSGMPASRSPRPYTTFELDHLRQHAKSDLPLDYYATNRQCGGSHTTTMPHQRFTRNFNHLLTEDEQPDEIIQPHKEEVGVLGADGQIYKGRVERIEAKLPSRISRDRQNSNSNQNQLLKSAAQRPMSARNGSASPQLRQYSAGKNSRPQSARVQMRPDHNEQHSNASTPPPDEFMMEESPEEEIDVELPVQGE